MTCETFPVLTLANMSTDPSIPDLVPFAQRVKKQEAQRAERTIVELERENAELRRKYHKALELLREYKRRAELTAGYPVVLEVEPLQQFSKEKPTSVWKDRLLRMNSISPRKEPRKPEEEKPVEVLELAEALNSGGIRLSPHQADQEDISSLLSLRAS